MRLEWQQTQGGYRPEWALRCYGEAHFAFYNTRIIGRVRLTNPKKKRWMVIVHVDPFTTRILCHFDRLPQLEVLDAAKLLLQGYANE